MVNDHCALVSETWLTSATVGTSGAPRLLTSATTSATRTRTGTRRRCLHDCPDAPGSFGGAVTTVHPEGVPRGVGWSMVKRTP